MNWENRKLTWRYDWLWLIAYAVIVMAYLVWSLGFRHKIVLEEAAALTLAIAAANLLRGWLIVKKERT